MSFEYIRQPALSDIYRQGSISMISLNTEYILEFIGLKVFNKNLFLGLNL